MKKSISIHTLATNQYPTLDGLSAAWVRVLGLPGKYFKMLIWGPSGAGKSTFTVELCIELTQLGKVYYCSREEGEGKSFQDVIIRTNAPERCKPGTFMLGDDTLEELREKLKTNNARFVVIDSVQYMDLTMAQYKRLVKDFPKKAFILVSWEDRRGEPKNEHAKNIRYKVDIKAQVRDGVMTCESRFGATEPYVVIPDKAKRAGHKASQQQRLLL